jgi:hypothetical protein
MQPYPKMLFLFSVLILNYNYLFSQETTLTETLSFINHKLNGKCSVDVVNATIIAKFYEKGKMVREDKIKYTWELDIETTNYDAKESTVNIFCREEYKECVSRKMLIRKVVNSYSRVNFEADEKDSESLIIAFNHLIKLASDPTYKKFLNFEQP